MIKNEIYFPGLNGLRAIAALAVIIMHVVQSSWFTAVIGKYTSFPIGSYGVTLFFVLSGFLITYLLLEEKSRSGTVKTGNFYMRRILRIWPLYFLFIILCVIVYWLNGRADLILNDRLWYIVLFAPNVLYALGAGIFILAHYWSLGVEEQFYLFWPWVVKYVKKLFLWALIFGALFFLLKITFRFMYGSSSFIYRIFHNTRFDCMMVGALGAIVYRSGNEKVMNIFAKKWIQLISWLLFIGLGFKLIPIPGVISQQIFALASMSLIFGQIIPGKALINLENKFFNHIGKISYGIYIYHPLWVLLFTLFMKKLGISAQTGVIIIFPIVLTLTLLTAHISYKYFEKPFLSLKKRYTY